MACQEGRGLLRTLRGDTFKLRLVARRLQPWGEHTPFPGESLRRWEAYARDRWDKRRGLLAALRGDPGSLAITSGALG